MPPPLSALRGPPLPRSSLHSRPAPAIPCHLPHQLPAPGLRPSLSAEVGQGRRGAHSSELQGCRAGLQGGRGPGLPRCYKGRHLRWRPLLAAPGASRCPCPCPSDSASACPDMGRQKELVSRCGEMLHIRYRLLRQALAECLGTLILVVSGGS
ncbi:hypothetical protein P7K49_001284 [Saguinus oedipus]|uniref:Uncharacterized protein n=1 Tax=Saguinus oedipus TaxID=9490 RepID=A0ABQ9WE41_SAGOE|nr:hypothetical protein P7K49_001284 [Saguinus oedipus]